MKKIMFYITGHGYGHATRCLEVIKQIQKRAPDAEIHIQSNAPVWLFELNLKRGYRLLQKICDVAAIQKNSYDVDQKQTLLTFEKFYHTFENRIPTEVNYIKENQIDKVVADIPPLAFLAAKQAGIPSIGITNFSWDWIYQPYTKQYPHYEWIIDAIQEAYQQSDLLLRLPFHGDLQAFPNIRDISLIARQARVNKTEVRKILKVDPHQKLVLVAFRSEDLQQVQLNNLAVIHDYHFLFFVDVPNHTNFISVPANFMPFQNLVAACDVVISKPGYGIVSECIANRMPLLYTSRKNFPEYNVLASVLDNFNIGKFIPYEDFFAGNWGEYLQQIQTATTNWQNWELNGAEIAAQIILEF